MWRWARNLSFNSTQPIYSACMSPENTHKLMGFDMKVNFNTRDYSLMYGFCFFKLFPIGCIVNLIVCMQRCSLVPRPGNKASGDAIVKFTDQSCGILGTFLPSNATGNPTPSYRHMTGTWWAHDRHMRSTWQAHEKHMTGKPCEHVWGGGDTRDAKVTGNEVSLEGEKVEDNERSSVRGLQACRSLHLQSSQPLLIRSTFLWQQQITPM